MLSSLHSKINFTSLFYYLTILLAFSAPFSWKASRIILILIIITWLIEFNYTKLFTTIKQSKFLTILSLFVIFQLLTQFWTETALSENYSYFRNYFLWLVIPILASSLKKEYPPVLITTFLLAMAISEITAYGMYFELWTIRGHGPEYPSPFIHHTAYSVFMAFTAILLLNRLYSSHYDLKEKLVMAIFFLTVTGNLFISQGRTGQLAFAIAIVVAGMMHFHLRIKTFVLSFLFMATIFTTAYYVSPMFEKRVSVAVNEVKRIGEGDYNSSWGSRAAWIILASEIFKDHPIVGVGIGDDRAVAQTYIDNDRVQFSQHIEEFLPKHHFHNQYLMIIVHGGLIGIILFLGIFYFILRMPIMDQEIKNISILFTVILLVSFIASPFLLIGEVRTLFILFASIFCIASLTEHSTQAKIT